MSGNDLIPKGGSDNLASIGEGVDPLKNVQIPKEKYAGILLDSFHATLLGKVPFLGPLLEGVERFKQGVREEKMTLLLKGFEKRFQSSEQSLEEFRKIFQSRSGVILFEKIVQILDSGAEDTEWIDLLSNVLKNMTAGEIETKFDEISFVLAQISKLSPQALILLGKYHGWSRYKFTGATTMSKQTVVGDWDSQIAKHFCSELEATSSGLQSRVAHTFKELESTGMVAISQTKQLICTDVGEVVRKHIFNTSISSFQ